MDLDFTAITAAVINQQIENVSKSLAGELRHVWMNNSTSFSKYLRNAKKRYEHTKTILYKDKPVLFKNIYVDAELRAEQTVKSEVNVLDELVRGKRLLVSATAGAGKSFFAKSIFLKLLGSGIKIPLMIELRHLNDTDNGILATLAEDLRSFRVPVADNQIVDLLSDGRFVLILDGFDELNVSKAKQVSEELRYLNAAIRESSIMVTSRPEDDLEYLSDFEVYRVNPFSLMQARQLVMKLEYDKPVKNLFLEKLESGLFDEHSDFLSNPLLLTIMLMTFSEVAEIPSKMHIFYEQAFDTLFYKHDASKGMYKRETKCGLAIDDFKDVLCCVSASSYIREQISVTNTELLNYVRKAKRTADIIKLDPQKFKQDLLQTVCILISDGNRYTFSHRSFQEYFAALFLVKFSFDKKIELYHRYLNRALSDNALNIAFEVNQSQVEKEFIEPYIGQVLADEPSAFELLRGWSGKLSLVWAGPKATGRPIYSLENPTSDWRFQCFLESAYHRLAKKHIKFGVLTKKAFVNELGKIKEPKVINLGEVENGDDSYVLLESLGVLDIAKKRLEFLHSIRDSLEKKNERQESDNIDEWL